MNHARPNHGGRFRIIKFKDGQEAIINDLARMHVDVQIEGQEVVSDTEVTQKQHDAALAKVRRKPDVS